MLDQWVNIRFVRWTLCSGLGAYAGVICAAMSLAYDAERRRSTVPGASPKTVAGRFARQASAAAANTITASQARAARQREARRDEQAVAAWLRELAGRPR
jgi:hypothetical protein